MMIYSAALVVFVPDTIKGIDHILRLRAEDCISIRQLWSFVPIIEEFQAAIVTEKNWKYMQYVN